MTNYENFSKICMPFVIHAKNSARRSLISLIFTIFILILFLESELLMYLLYWPDAAHLA